MIILQLVGVMFFGAVFASLMVETNKKQIENYQKMLRKKNAEIAKLKAERIQSYMKKVH